MSTLIFYCYIWVSWLETSHWLYLQQLSRRRITKSDKFLVRFTHSLTKASTHPLSLKQKEKIILLDGKYAGEIILPMQLHFSQALLYTYRGVA